MLRWWNGVRWGEETREADPPATPASAAPSPAGPAAAVPHPPSPYPPPLSGPYPPGTGAGPYQPSAAPYPAGPGPYPPGPGFPVPAATRNGYSTAGIILGSLAFLILPVILGPAGLILGGIAMSRGESRGVVALVVSATGTVVGILLGALVYGGLI
ncbi:MAG: hypothetical protein ABJB47_23505 [Actinomycetota bacterium]